MKKQMWYTLLISAPALCMEQPPMRVTITKDQLIEFIRLGDANKVLFACLHQNAGNVIDHEVVETAHKHRKDEPKLSKSGSIAVMIEKHHLAAPTSESEKALHKPHRHHSGKHHELKPKEKLLSLIQDHDSATLEKEMGTSSVHFVDYEVVNAAESECQSLRIQLAKAEVISSLLAKYVPRSERRKSCMVKGNKDND